MRFTPGVIALDTVRGNPRSGFWCRAYTRARPAASVAEALNQVGVRVDAPVAQERPPAAHVLAALEVDVGHQHLRLVAARGRDELALRPADEAVAPELRALGLAARVGLEAGAIRDQHRQAVGDRVRALDRDPGVALAR